MYAFCLLIFKNKKYTMNNERLTFWYMNSFNKNLYKGIVTVYFMLLIRVLIVNKKITNLENSKE